MILLGKTEGQGSNITGQRMSEEKEEKKRPLNSSTKHHSKAGIIEME